MLRLFLFYCPIAQLLTRRNRGRVALSHPADWAGHREHCESGDSPGPSGPTVCHHEHSESGDSPGPDRCDWEWVTRCIGPNDSRWVNRVSQLGHNEHMSQVIHQAQTNVNMNGSHAVSAQMIRGGSTVWAARSS